MTHFFRHPILSRASNTFILCGLSSSASQLFLSSNIDPDRSVKFALSGSLSIIPVWFAWNAVLSDTSSIAKRIAVEAFMIGPIYLASILWWNTTLTDQRIGAHSFETVKNRFIPLCLDALKVVPAYNLIVWFAVAPPMRGYALTGCQFFWNMYLSWFVHNSIVS